MHHDESIRRICIIFGGALGDMVLLLPSLIAVHQRYPDARIEMLGLSSWLNLLEQRGYVDKILPLDKVPLHLLFQSNPPKSHPFFEFLGGFDLIISWFGDREGLFARNLQSITTSPAFIFPFKDHERYAGHVSEYYLSTLQRAGIPAGPPRYSILPSTTSRLKEEHAPEAESTLNGPFICVHPGSGSRAKNWPLDRFIHVSQEIVRRLPVRVCYVLGPAEHDRFWEEEICAGIQSMTIFKDLSVLALATLLERSSLYLGNDSGPTHLAATTGVPTVAIFGPTSSKKWVPRGPHVHLLQQEMHCRPCNNDVMETCDSRQCLTLITPDDVLDVVFAIMTSSLTRKMQ